MIIDPSISLVPGAPGGLGNRDQGSILLTLQPPVSGGFRRRRRFQIDHSTGSAPPKSRTGTLGNCTTNYSAVPDELQPSSGMPGPLNVQTVQ